MSKRYQLTQVSQLIGVDGQVLVEFIKKEWIKPVDQNYFDEEDLARSRLILELMEDLGVNDEAVPIILHLVDQLHCLHSEIKKITD